MAFDPFDKLVEKLNETPSLFSGGGAARRAKLGNENIIKVPTALVLADIVTPKTYDEEYSQDRLDSKKVTLQATVYAVVGKFKTQQEAEDAAMNLALDIVERIQGVEMEVTYGSRTEYRFWELIDIGLVEDRSANECACAIEFQMPLWV